MKGYVKTAVWKLNQKLWKRKKKANLKKYPELVGERSGISVISCNCIGGVVMSELNMVFASPTVNCFLSAPDFLKLCENLKEYLALEPQPQENDDFSYPLCRLGDLTIHAVHYKSFEEFREIWDRRKTRVRFDRLFLIFTDRDGFTEDMLPRIARLPYKKVLFAKQAHPGYDFVCRLPGFETEESIGNAADYRGCTGKRVYAKYPFAEVFLDMIKKK